MTDRLSTLLHDEGSGIDVPRPDPAGVIARGRHLRRRRRTTAAVAGAVAAVLVVGVALTAVATWRGDERPEPARLPDRAAYEQRGAWAVNDEVHVGDHVVAVPRGTTELRYTSAGVVAFAFSLEGAAVTLVTPEGEARSLTALGVDIDAPHAPVTDPSSPYLPYVRSAGSPHMRELVVIDLSSDEKRVVGSPWRAKGQQWTDLGIDGDLVLCSGCGRAYRQVNWRTGQEVPVPHAGAGFGFPQSYAHDVYVGPGDDLSDPTETWQVRSRSDGSVLSTFPAGGGEAEAALSPDGRYLKVSGTQGFTVYDVTTGDATRFPDRVATGYGWTPHGDLVGKSHDTSLAYPVEVCDPRTGVCTEVSGPTEGTLALEAGATTSGTASY